MTDKQLESPERFYVSITGLQPSGVLGHLRFWWHAIASLRQARKAKGCRLTQVGKINGVMHTLSVWESDTDMRRFLYSGAHRQAIRAFPKIGTGLTCGFWTDAIPSWGDVHRLWKERGRAYGELPNGPAQPKGAAGRAEQAT